MRFRADLFMVLPLILMVVVGQTPASTVPRATATPYSVGGEVSAPRLVRTVKISKPEKCKTIRLRLDDGAFMFRVTVTANGEVTDVTTLKTPHLEPACRELEQAYRNAIAQWRYEPARLHGRPVSVYLTITALLEPR